MTEADVRYSVLLPVYKADVPEHFAIALQSMIDQTLPPSDIVIVCDGPLSEGVDEVIDAFQKRWGDLVQVMRLSENMGLGEALSHGLGVCKYNIVARMDSDDISRPDRCERLMVKLLSDSLDMVGGAIEEFEHVPGDLGMVRDVPLSHDEISRYARFRCPFNHMTVMFKRESVERVGGYLHFPFLEDYYLWGRMIQGGCVLGNIPDIVVDARVGAGTYRRRSNRRYLRSQVNLFREFERRGFVTKAQSRRAIFSRTCISALPKNAVRFVYSSILRTRR